MGHALSFPTILVAEDNDGICGSVVRDLQHEGYFVLVAQDGPEAIEIARVHSRPIQVMLTSNSMNGRTLAATVKRFRPNTHILFITRQANEEAPDVLRADGAVAKVQELLKPPESPSPEHMEGRQALAAGKRVA